MKRLAGSEGKSELTVHEDYKAMIPAQVLGALEPGEACLLREHLIDCAVCRAELDAVSEAVSPLALAADAVEPPAELRDRILDIIKTTAQEKADGKREDPPRDNVIPFTARPRKSSGVARILTIAASIACIAALAALWVIWKRERQSQAEIAQINRQLNDAQSQLAHEREIREMFSSPDARIAQLQGLEPAPDATAKFAINQKTGRALLIAHNLPQAPAGKEYQMWYIVDGKPLPGGVFKADQSGNAEERETVPVEGRNAPVFAVTLEPAGGVQSPTGAAYLKTPAAAPAPIS